MARWGILKWPQMGDFGWPPGAGFKNSIENSSRIDIDDQISDLSQRFPSSIDHLGPYDFFRRKGINSLALFRRFIRTISFHRRHFFLRKAIRPKK